MNCSYSNAFQTTPSTIYFLQSSVLLPLTPILWTEVMTGISFSFVISTVLNHYFSPRTFSHLTGFTTFQCHGLEEMRRLRWWTIKAAFLDYERGGAEERTYSGELQRWSSRLSIMTHSLTRTWSWSSECTGSHLAFACFLNLGSTGRQCLYLDAGDLGQNWHYAPQNHEGWRMNIVNVRTIFIFLRSRFFS